MMKKDDEQDEIRKNKNPTTPGHVKQICQNFLTHADFGMAHRLQQEEYAVHFDRNRTHRRDSRLGVTTARSVEDEEKQEFIAKQFDFYRQKQTIEGSDNELARRLQDEMERQTDSLDRIKLRPQSNHEEQDWYEEIDPPSTFADTSSDEQLARILQEEEDQKLSASSTHRSHIKSTFV